MGSIGPAGPVGPVGPVGSIGPFQCIVPTTFLNNQFHWNTEEGYVHYTVRTQQSPLELIITTAHVCRKV